MDNHGFLVTFVKMKSPIIIPQDLNNTIHSELHLLLEVRLNRFYKENKNIIEDYQYMKAKLEELECRLNLEFKLYILNSKTSGQIVNAKVKFPFTGENGAKSKYPYLNVHIGKLSDFKGGLNDPEIKKIALEKIKKYIDFKHPLVIQNTDNQSITFFF